MRNQNWFTNPKLTCANYNIYVNYQISRYCLPDYALCCHVAGAFFSCFTAAAKWSLLENQCLDVKLGLSFSHHVSLAVYNPILSAISQSQNVRCFFCVVPQEVLTSYTVLNDLVVLSLEVRGVVCTWERTCPSVIVMRPTLYHKNQNPFRVELAIRAWAGIKEFDSKPSSKKALTWLPSQTGHFCSSVIYGRYSENVLWWNTIPWLPSLDLVHTFLLILRNKVSSCCTKWKMHFNDFWMIYINPKCHCSQAALAVQLS